MRVQILFASFLLAAAGAACTDEVRPPADLGTPGSAEPAGQAQAGNGAISVADLVGNPAAYAGRTVTVEADVEEVRGPRAFTVDEDAPLAGGIDNDLLVISRQASNLAPIDDQWVDNRVRITGRIAQLSLVELEREVGWDLDPQIEAELEERRIVLIAESVSRVDE